MGWPGDHAKCLEITRHNQSTELFKFGESHSGYDEVDLYISDNKQTIWILDHRYGRVGASFDFPSQVFKGEGQAILPSDQAKMLPPST